MSNRLLSKIMLAILVTAILAACPLTDDEENRLVAGKYVVEVEFVSSNAGYQRRGWHVNNKGEVWAYDVAGNQAEYEAAVDAADLSNGTPEDLLELKYSYQANMVLQVNASELLDNVVLLRQAYGGELESPGVGPIDAGSWFVRGWLHDREHVTYREVFIVSCLELLQKNTTDAAEEFYTWLSAQMYLPCEDMFAAR